MPGGPTITWRVSGDGPDGDAREISATFVGDLPTWVRVVPASMAGGVERPARGQDVLGLVFGLFFIAGAVVAAINVRTGRWDRRGAARLAVVAFILCFVSDVLGSHHSMTVYEETWIGHFPQCPIAYVRSLLQYCFVFSFP